ncbi:MAG: hypothetical protein M1269_01465 [Chloroflexi bacterium]|nr:hypothetical protein [Chloroflexota bacterium]
MLHDIIFHNIFFKSAIFALIIFLLIKLEKRRKAKKKPMIFHGLEKYGFENYDFTSISYLVLEALESGVKYDIPSLPGDAYYRLVIEGKIDVWVVKQQDNNTPCFRVYFRGDNKNRIRIVGKIPDPTCKYEGGYNAWGGIREEAENDEGDFPFTFKCPGFLLQDSRETPFCANLSLSTFAESLNLFENEEEFEQKSGLRHWSTRSVIADEVFTGIVTGHTTFSNPKSGDLICCITVNTLGNIDIDVFIPVLKLNSKLKKGCIAVVCYSDIIGYFLDDWPNR